MTETKIVSNRLSDTLEFEFNSLALNYGSQGAPALAFQAEQTLGLYRDDTGSLSISTGNFQAARFRTARVNFYTPECELKSTQSGANTRLTITNNSVTQPSYSSLYLNHITALYGSNVELASFVDASDVRQMELRHNGAPVVQVSAPGGISEYGLKINAYNAGVNTALNIPKTGEVQFNNGSSVLPSISFQNDPDCGLFRYATNSVGIATDGQLTGIWSPTGLTVYKTGTLADPAINWTSRNSGFASLTQDHTDIVSDSTHVADFHHTTTIFKTTGGTSRFDISPTAIRCLGDTQFRLNAGSVGLPALSWNADTNSGFYHDGVNSGRINYSDDGVKIMHLDSTVLDLDVPLLSLIAANPSGLVGVSVVNNHTNNDSTAYLQTQHDNGLYTASLRIESFMDSGSYRNFRMSHNGIPLMWSQAHALSASTDLQLWVRDGAVNKRWMYVPPSGEARFLSGSESSPSVTFQDEVSTGLFRSGVGDMRFVALGTSHFRISGNGLEMMNGKTIETTAGTFGAPSYAFAEDTTTGFYSYGLGKIGLATDSGTWGGLVITGAEATGVGASLEMKSTGGLNRSWQLTVDSRAASDSLSSNTTASKYLWMVNSAPVATFSATGSKIKGTTTNDVATAGDVGQWIQSTVGNVLLPTTNTYGDLTSISLPAGDWDVSMLGGLNAADEAGISNYIMGISTTSGNSSTGLTQGYSSCNQYAASGGLLQKVPMAIPAIRISLASTTTVYLKYYGVYTSGTPNGFGSIRARRVR